VYKLWITFALEERHLVFALVFALALSALSFLHFTLALAQKKKKKKKKKKF